MRPPHWWVPGFIAICVAATLVLNVCDPDFKRRLPSDCSGAGYTKNCD